MVPWRTVAVTWLDWAFSASEAFAALSSLIRVLRCIFWAFWSGVRSVLWETNALYCFVADFSSVAISVGACSLRV